MKDCKITMQHSNGELIKNQFAMTIETSKTLLCFNRSTNMEPRSITMMYVDLNSKIAYTKYNMYDAILKFKFVEKHPSLYVSGFTSGNIESDVEMYDATNLNAYLELLLQFEFDPLMELPVFPTFRLIRTVPMQEWIARRIADEPPTVTQEDVLRAMQLLRQQELALMAGRFA